MKIADQNNLNTDEQQIPLSFLQQNLKKMKSMLLVRDYEDLFRILCVLVIGVFSFFFNGVLNFRQWASENNVSVIPWSYNLISLTVVLLLFALKNLIKVTCWKWTMENLNEKYTGSQRSYRAKKIVKWIYDTLYYSSTTIFSLWAFRDAPWLPSIFGGQGQCSNLYYDYPQYPQGELTNYLVMYHMVQFGNHIFSFLDLVLFKRNEEQKFYEYTLHHFMAAGLIFYSGLFNILNVSVLVLMIHDMGDITIAGGRAYADMKFKSKYLMYLFVPITISVWIGTRIFIFPSCVIYESYMKWGTFQIWEIIKYGYGYLLTMLIILQCMHLYWTLFMLKMCISYLIMKKWNNVYDNKDFKVKKKQ